MQSLARRGLKCGIDGDSTVRSWLGERLLVDDREVAPPNAMQLQGLSFDTWCDGRGPTCSESRFHLFGPPRILPASRAPSKALRDGGRPPTRRT